VLFERISVNPCWPQTTVVPGTGVWVTTVLDWLADGRGRRITGHVLINPEAIVGV
jgi:hypothetical protein